MKDLSLFQSLMTISDEQTLFDLIRQLLRDIPYEVTKTEASLFTTESQLWEKKADFTCDENLLVDPENPLLKSKDYMRMLNKLCTFKEVRLRFIEQRYYIPNKHDDLIGIPCFLPGKGKIMSKLPVRSPYRETSADIGVRLYGFSSPSEIAPREHWQEWHFGIEQSDAILIERKSTNISSNYEYYEDYRIFRPGLFFGGGGSGPATKEDISGMLWVLVKVAQSMQRDKIEE